MSKHWHRAIGAGVASVLATAALAVHAGSTGHSLSDIAGTAALAMHAKAEAQGYRGIDVQVRPLDGRLALAKCAEPLQTLPAHSGRALGAVSVGVRCPGGEPWTLYVRGEVSASQTIPVLQHSLQRGDLVGSNDIALENRRINQDFGGIVTDPVHLVGMEARRNLDAGTPLRHSDLISPVLVERGQTVSIVSGGGGLRVSMQGKALASGSVGDRVLVANLNSGKRVEGVIAPDGSVTIQ